MSNINAQRNVVIVGVPRSGTSVLHALACTDPRTNPYIGEVSYLRLLIAAYRSGAHVYEKHTRYLFSDRADYLRFHRSIIRRVISKLRRELGQPKCLVIKDPMLAEYIAEVRELVERAEIFAIVRHPADVIASWRLVTRRRGTEDDIENLIFKHNSILRSILRSWDKADCKMVLYEDLRESEISEVRRILRLEGIDPSKIWSGALKRYPEDGDPNWTTTLFGQPLQVNHLSRQTLAPEELNIVLEKCMPLYRKVLELRN